MTARVRFRPAAEASLFNLYTHIAESAGTRVAGNYLARIKAVCMDLMLFPQRGMAREDLAPGLRTIAFERRATIAYRIIGRDIEIVAIAYAGRQFKADPYGEP